MRPGAEWTSAGVRFALRSEHASAVAVGLFDRAGDQAPRQVIALERGSGHVWQTEVAGLRPGQLYALRVDGPNAPERGHRFDPTRWLVDPYARATTGGVRWRRLAAGAWQATAPQSVVVDPAFDWQGTSRPAVPWRDTVIYEAHVKGMTALHPAVAPAQRGTFGGMASGAIVAHLRRLGVTTVELLPIHQIGDERHLAQRGLSNYWGYSPLALFAPHAGYTTAPLGQVDEAKAMVRELHRAGIEVLLDVVFNHTAEGDRDGPTLSLRGIDNLAYYRLDPDDPSRYLDTTGCGNTLDVEHEAGRRLVLDCLRAWCLEYQIDGFRFDLAASLGRERGTGATAEFSSASRLLREIGADPLLRERKLIAEPWDLAPGGYRLGQFPAGWAEWNDRARDAVRRFWRGDPGQAPELVERLAGSRDLFGQRAPQASVNYVASHDGFTLADLTAYEHKHNLANGEENRDGHQLNWSRSWGQEGPTDDPAIRATRARVRRSLLATALLLRGVPMLLHGDELLRSQGGNNNAYCQDNERSWLDWRRDAESAGMLAFTERLLALRRLMAREPGGFSGTGHGALVAFGEDGRAIGPGGVAGSVFGVAAGRWLLLLNASDRDAAVALPPGHAARRFVLALDTSDTGDTSDTPDPNATNDRGARSGTSAATGTGGGETAAATRDAGAQTVPAHSLLVLEGSALGPG